MSGRPRRRSPQSRPPPRSSATAPAESPALLRSASRPLPAITVLPLRLFLGLTFIYAGIQKLTDPGFLQPG